MGLTAAQVIGPLGKPCLPLFCLDCHEQCVVLQPELLLSAEPAVLFRGGGKEPVRCFFQQGRTLPVQGAVVHPAHRLRRRDLFRGQQTLLGKDPEIDEVGVACKGGKTLVGTVAVAGGTNGQDLPVGLLCFGEKVYKIKGFAAQSADTKRSRQTEYGHQNATCTHGAFLLVGSVFFSPSQHLRPHPR